MMEEKVEPVNGVNMEVLGMMLENIKKQPEMAKTTFSVRSEWNGEGFHIKSKCKSIKMGKNEAARTNINTIVYDFPPQFSGGDNGPTVCESCMASIGACIAQTMVLHASAMGIHLDNIRIDVEGDIDIRGFAGLSKTVKPGAQQIRVGINIKSRTATKEQIQTLYEIGTRLSPAVDTLINGTSIQVKVGY